MEQRTSKRIPINMEAYLTRGDTTSKVFIAGVSEKGLYVIVESGSWDSIEHNVGALSVRFETPSGKVLKLPCKVAWSDKHISGSSLIGIGLEVPSPPPEFKKFYKSSFYKVKTDISYDPIAVIGMSCYYPGAPDLRSFWENILSRRRAFRQIPEQRLPLSEYYDPDTSAPDKTYAKRAAVIDGFEFDWVKRGIPKTVVDSSDIVHWLALEVALRALEDSGLSRESIPSDRSGVILGNTMTGEHSRSQHMRLRWPYVKKVLKAAATGNGLPAAVIDALLDDTEVYYKAAFAPVTEDTLAGNLSNTIAGRICNFLDMHGGGYTVDGACSSSLIAVATAANALSNGTLDLAIAGGIDISLDTFELVGFAKTNALTREDMRVYDRRASGFIPGEGAGFVVLKRLQDARADGNYIYAVLNGWGVSSDGKGGITAPKAQTQALAIRRAYGKAGYSLNEVDFIEGHGTGTTAGDKAELEGIAAAVDGDFTGPLRRCGITSLKSLIGHTKAASGIGGFIKAVLAVNRRVIPPTAGCEEPNPIFNDKARRVYPVLDGEIRDHGRPVRAGVSGMGFGGINCHVTVESAGEPAAHIMPSLGERELLASYQETELFVLSAGSREDMLKRVRHLKNLAEGISTGEMVDLSRELAGEASEGGPFRSAMVAGHPEALIDCLDRVEPIISSGDLTAGRTVSDPGQDVWVGDSAAGARVGFLFPGQGSQQLNMGRSLVERYGWARDLSDEADTRLIESGYEKIGEHVYRPLDRALDSEQVASWKVDLSRPEIAQPAICTASVLWMKRLNELGVRPVAVGGHSLGELTAFHAAGAFDFGTLMDFAAFRGKATSAGGGRGAMASLACGREEAGRLLKDVEGYAVIANMNSPAQTVVSGERPAVEEALRLASLKGIRATLLPVANAFHSSFMSGAADTLEKHAPVPDILAGTAVKLFTSVDGSRVMPGTDLRRHFAGQLTHTVDFISLVENMRQECDILVEAGPGRVLTGLVGAITGPDNTQCFPVEPRAGDVRSLNSLLGCCFVSGVEINWPKLFENRLVRPFVPPSKRVFIDNPCERPFAPMEEETLNSLITLDSTAGAPPSGPSAVGDDSGGLFTRQQTDYIRRLIHAETRGGVYEPGLPALDNPDATPTVPDVPGEHALSLQTGPQDPDLLLELASETTGFPKDRLSLDHRLLDDLNLDSIKAGNFVAKAMKLYAAHGAQVDPTAMANSSLREIYELVGLNKAPTAPATSDETGGARRSEPAAQEAVDGWVRNFRVTYAEQPLETRRNLEESLADVSNEKRRVLLVFDAEADGPYPEMQGILTRNGVDAASMDYEGLRGYSPEDDGMYDYFVFMLPRGKETGPTTAGQVRRMASRMYSIGRVINSMKTRVPKPAYALVQFGDGGFHGLGRDVSIESKGGTAFICSLHLENPAERIRVMEFPSDSCGAEDAARVLHGVIEGIRAGGEFGLEYYDGGFGRHVPVLEPVGPLRYKDRRIAWTADDVVLVTGGAKGITAECALEFARQKGVKLALVGSTPLADDDGEIQESLRRFVEDGIVHRYFAGDISDKAGVVELKNRIEKELGIITGVIHGAAVNRPRRAEQVNLEEALDEIAPKLLGAINICECLMDNPPKMFAGLGSIIGVTGMAGNAWYGFSNEVLGLVLQRFREHAGDVEIVNPAYSVWGDVGMGKRMGSLDFLTRMGILPIPREKGVGRFMQLVDKDPGLGQVIVASRLGGLDTYRKAAVKMPRSARFLEEVLFFEKGVEIETKALLTLAKDPYLEDHDFRGTHLLPTVMGIEAMAQAVSAVTDIDKMDYLRLENVRLSLPITVEQDGTTEVRITALVQDEVFEDGAIRVKAGITVDQTRFSKNHFEAIFVLGAIKDADAYKGELPEVALDIIPGEDLYGHMLFQGKMFQRIKSVRSLDDAGCVFDSSMNVSTGVGYITKDPFFRDTMLQSLQIILTDISALPVEVESWDMFLGEFRSGTHTIVGQLLQRDEDIVTGDVAAVNSEGRVFEILRGYKAKVVEKLHDAPRVDDLVSPDGRDGSLVNDRLGHYCRMLGKAAPAVSLTHKSGLHDMKKDMRHVMEEGLFRDAYRRLKTAVEDLPDEISLSWTKQGKPFAEGTNSVSISFSHDDRVCLCVAGKGAQGCDIETLTHRDEQEWKDMLGAARAPLFETVAGIDKSADRAGTRIWCALEALKKAAGMKGAELVYGGRVDDCLVFEGGGLEILTLPVKLLRGHERIVAITAPGKQDAVRGEEAAAAGPRGEMEQTEWGRYTGGGPQGQRIFTCRFPLGLKDNSTVGGGVYFDRYFSWIGKVREAALKPIGGFIADEFHSGHFMVTNYSETDITGHVRNDNVIDARTWIDGMSGNSLVLHFEWRRLSADGTKKRVAYSRHQVSWIRTTGHGIVEPVEPPEFFTGFLSDGGFMPAHNGESAFVEALDVREEQAAGLGKAVLETDVLKEDDILEESVIDTTMEHSNLAQNIYFSNYFKWQGQLRDRFLFRLSPDLYRGMGLNGQFACIHSHVKHLREAMPFDRIYVTMKLARMYERGLELYFEYYKGGPGGRKEKLAYGAHTLAWVRVDGAGDYIPQEIPAAYSSQIMGGVAWINGLRG